MFASNDLDRLVGRSRELEDVLERLGAARFIAITGPGGSGKTRLAEAVLESILGSGGDAGSSTPRRSAMPIDPFGDYDRPPSGYAPGNEPCRRHPRGTP